MKNKNEEICLNCQSIPVYNSEFGFYKCPSCSNTWAYDEDDPDYKELDYEQYPFLSEPFENEIPFEKLVEDDDVTANSSAGQQHQFYNRDRI